MQVRLVILLSLAAIALAFLLAWADSVTARGDALSRLEAEVTANPRDAELARRLGWAYFYEARGGKDELSLEAIEAFERAAKLDPGAPLGYELGMAYMLRLAVVTRQPGEADDDPRALLQRAMAAFGSDPDATSHSADRLSGHGMASTILAGMTQDGELLARGLAEMDQAVAEDPESIHPRLARGFTLLNMPPPVGDPQKVVADLNALIGSTSRESKQQALGVLRVLLGDYHASLQQPGEARRHYEAARGLQSTGAQVAKQRLARLDAEGPDLK